MGEEPEVEAMNVQYSPMTIEDYEEACQLWQSTAGMGLSDADSRENIESFLDRNPDLCFIARHESKLVGTVLCGHDGRRGFIYHLAVSTECRKQGIGTALVRKCLSGLESLGIGKCCIVVFKDNQDGLNYWLNQGWIDRTDLAYLQMPLG